MRSFNRFCLLIALSFAVTFSSFATVVSKISKEIIEITLENAIKTSGRASLSFPAKKIAIKTFEKIAIKYGDDAIKLVDDLGLDLLDAVEKHGDEVVEAMLKVTPEARLSVIRNIDELLPIAKRLGTDIVEIEAKSPGLVAPMIQTFGDDIGAILLKTADTKDIPRLLKYAQKADNPDVVKSLAQAYSKEKSSLFARIPPNLVLSSGLSASMLYGTHELTRPATALADSIKQHPEVANTALKYSIGWFTAFITFVAIMLFWRFNLMPWQQKK